MGVCINTQNSEIMEPMTAQMSAGAECFLACLPFVTAALLATYVIILDKTQN